MLTDSKIKIFKYKIRWPVVLVIIIIFTGLFVWMLKKEINIRSDADKNGINAEDEDFLASNLTGIKCKNAEHRPFAVMLSSDIESRPLSGIAQADMVFEMVVTPPDLPIVVTRLMAVFQCEQPSEIGSIRSAREDFLPLVAGLDAIYAHWGGEKGTLNKLDNGILDNIDAMKYEGETFYRKEGIPQPHDGFTNSELLLDKAEELNYSFKNRFEGYNHRETEEEDSSLNILSEKSIIKLNYKSPYDVEWRYDRGKDKYLRYRNGMPEIDKNTGKQVEASSIVRLKTTWFFVREYYIRVRTQGEGNAYVYQNGKVLSGSWRKNGFDDKLEFLDNQGEEITFVPGKRWIEVEF